MLSKIVVSLVTILSLSICSPDLVAQQRGGQQRGGGRRLPQVGSVMPSVKAFDESGKEFTTKSLRGSYSVIVFGCLT